MALVPIDDEGIEVLDWWDDNAPSYVGETGDPRYRLVNQEMNRTVYIIEPYEVTDFELLAALRVTGWNIAICGGSRIHHNRVRIIFWPDEVPQPMLRLVKTTTGSEKSSPEKFAENSPLDPCPDCGNLKDSPQHVLGCNRD